MEIDKRLFSLIGVALLIIVIGFILENGDLRTSPGQFYLEIDSYGSVEDYLSPYSIVTAVHGIDLTESLMADYEFSYSTDERNWKPLPGFYDLTDGGITEILLYTEGMELISDDYFIRAKVILENGKSEEVIGRTKEFNGDLFETLDGGIPFTGRAISQPSGDGDGKDEKKPLEVEDACTCDSIEIKNKKTDKPPFPKRAPLGPTPKTGSDKVAIKTDVEPIGELSPGDLAVVQNGFSIEIHTSRVPSTSPMECQTEQEVQSTISIDGDGDGKADIVGDVDTGTDEEGNSKKEYKVRDDEGKPAKGSSPYGNKEGDYEKDDYEGESDGKLETTEDPNDDSKETTTTADYPQQGIPYPAGFVDGMKVNRKDKYKFTVTGIHTCVCEFELELDFETTEKTVKVHKNKLTVLNCG